MEKELLLVLARKTGCMYLSDLKFINETGRIKSELKRLEPREFPLKQWNDAIMYLTGQQVNFTSPVDAKAFLIETEFMNGRLA